MSDFKRAGLIYENLGIAADVLRTHKLRSGLIVLGVAIGVASLMGMVSILLGLKQSITSNVSSSEQTVLQVQKFSIFVGGISGDFFNKMRQAMIHRKDITEMDARALREQCPSLQHVVFVLQPHGPPPTLRYKNEKTRMVAIVGTEPSLLYIQSLDLEEGRMFTEEELRRGAKVVVLGHSPRRDLFPNVDPIGKPVRIGNNDFTVVGTFTERKTLFGDMGENFAMIPYTTYKSAMWREMDMQVVAASVRPGVSVEIAKDEVIRVMRKQRRLKADQENDFDITSSNAALEFINTITGPIALVLMAISSIALLVGGIGVMNLMLVSVTERTDEIGIRKAVGATRQDILWQFLIEAGFLTGFGGIIGILTGLGGALAVSYLSGLPASLSPAYITLGVVFSVSIGVFFGLYPAHRASKLQPINAIGYAK